MTILNPEPTSRIGPFDIVVDVTDDAACPAFDAALVGEDDPPVIARCIAVRGTAVDALLSLTLKADIVVDDPDVSARRVHVVCIETQLALNGCGVEYSGSLCLFDDSAHDLSPVRRGRFPRTLTMAVGGG